VKVELTEEFVFRSCVFFVILLRISRISYLFVAFLFVFLKKECLTLFWDIVDSQPLSTAIKT